jgi:hypothetical protein
MDAVLLPSFSTRTYDCSQAPDYLFAVIVKNNAKHACLPAKAGFMATFAFQKIPPDRYPCDQVKIF